MSETETTALAPQLSPTGMSVATAGEMFRSGETVMRTDTKGRKLEIKQLSLWEEMGLLAVAGPRSDNRRWMMYATLACCVRSIGGVPIVLPVKENQLQSLVQTVGAEGVAAVAALLADGAAVDDDEEDPAAATVTTADAAKN